MGIPVFSIILGFGNYQVGNCMFKVNSRNTRTRFELFSKLTIKSQLRSGIFIVNFEQIPQCCIVSIVNFEQVNAARTTFPELKLTSRSTQELGCLPSPINQRAWQGGVFHIHKCVISVFFLQKKVLSSLFFEELGSVPDLLNTQFYVIVEKEMRKVHEPFKSRVQNCCMPTGTPLDVSSRTFCVKGVLSSLRHFLANENPLK